MYTRKSRPEKTNLNNELASLVEEINARAITLKSVYLYCFSCGQPFPVSTIGKLNYLKCVSCNCVVDSSQKDYIRLTIADKELADAEFGMDAITINAMEL